MLLLIRAALALVLSLTSMLAYAQERCPINSTVVNYDFFSRYKHVGEIHQTIRISHKRFSIKTNKDTGFFISKRHTESRSLGILSDDVIQPLAYQSRNKAMDQRWSFIPKKLRIQGTMNKQPIRQTYKQWPIYDKSSYVLALRCALLRGQFGEKNFRVFDQGRVSTYNAKVLSKNKRIQTKLGWLDTTEVRLLVTPESTIYMLWFANNMNDLLVQRSKITGSHGASFSSIDQVKGL